MKTRLPLPLLIAAFALPASNSAIFALIPNFQDRYGFATWGLGLMTAASFASNVLAMLTLAGHADRGRSRTLLVGGLVCAVVGAGSFTLATHLWQFVAARALTGLGVGMFGPAARALAATIDKDDVGANIGLMQGIEMAGFTFGPVVATIVAERFGIRAPVAVLGAIAAAALGLLLLRLPAIPARGTHSRVDFRLLRRRPVLVSVLFGVLLYLPVGVYDSLWARYLQDRGASTLFVGVSLTLFGVPFMLAARPGGRLAERVGPVKGIAWSLLVILPATALYGQIPWPGLILSVGLIEAFAQAVAGPGVQIAMTRACPADRLAAGQALVSAAGLTTAATAAMIAAPIYRQLGSAWTFGLAAIAMGAIAALALALNREPQESYTFPHGSDGTPDPKSVARAHD